MASGLGLIVLLCLTSGLWLASDAQSEQSDDLTNSCLPGWTHFDGRCYIYFNTGRFWTDAERACTTVGGNLVSIYSPAQIVFLRDLIFASSGYNHHVWVGGSDATGEGIWLWSDGSRFEGVNWWPGQPDNAGGTEHCMEARFGDPLFINDLPCNHWRHYICSSIP
ncbi:galactose-specific lectin nattectin-like [Aulostomus maculatus]